MSLELPEPSFRYTLQQLNFYLSSASFGIDIYYWLSEEERNHVENHESDFSKKHTQLVKHAFLKMVGFLDNLTQEIDVKNISSFRSSSDTKDEKYSELANFSPSTFAIIAINKLLDDYWIRSSRKELITHLLSSENWVLRSSAYSYLFNGVVAKVDDDEDLLEQFKNFYNKYSEDKLSLIHGIFNSTHLHLIQYQSYLTRQYVNNIIEDIDIDSDYTNFLTSDLGYVFDNFRNLDSSEIEKVYKDKFQSERTRIIKEIIAHKPTEVQIIEQDSLPNTKSVENDVGFSHQIGRTFGKFFK